MQLQEAVKLIYHSIKKEPTIYADLGCGNGLFTQALATLLALESVLYAVDKNKNSLNQVSVNEDINLGKFAINFIKEPLPFKNLSGILMANSLHYVRDKHNFLLKAKAALSGNGYFIIVEYNNAIPNPWVPYPIKFSKLENVFSEIGFTSVEKLQTYPSRYQGTMYSALIRP